MRDSSDFISPAILAVILLFCVYLVHCEHAENARVASVSEHNITTHTDTHISKVTTTGYDFHYSKNNTSLTPTYLLEDGSIIREEEVEEDQQKLTPFVKSGDSIEYTVVTYHDMNRDYPVIRAHLIIPIPVAAK